MSIVAPFLAFFCHGMFRRLPPPAPGHLGRDHRTLLVACWLLGANHVATVVAAVWRADRRAAADSRPPQAAASPRRC
jgi:hypothetical protein